MHASSLENMWRCYRSYVENGPLERQPQTVVLDIGSYDVNGSYRQIFTAPVYRYVGADMEAGPGVDLVLENPYKLPFADSSIDIVVSGQAFEHSEFFWRIFEEMTRVLKPEGLIFLIAPSAGPIHRYPVDCYRFYPDAYGALAKHAACRLVEVWLDERGPWRDLVGVFQREGATPLKPGAFAIPMKPTTWAGTPGTPEEEATRGKVNYLNVLERLQSALTPKCYLEIGVRRGKSLALAKGGAIGVDPAPEIDVPLTAATRIVAETSDEFFAHHAEGVAPDLAFIDGMHLFEYALRDFMNVERNAAPGAVVVIDDIFPNHVRQARRERETRVWTGDVWRLGETLKKRRPDLFLLFIDTSPTGLLLIAGLDPQNRVLLDAYNSVVREIEKPIDPPAEILERRMAIAPDDPKLQRVLDALGAARRDGVSSQETVRRLRHALEATAVVPGPPAPEMKKKKWYRRLLAGPAPAVAVAPAVSSPLGQPAQVRLKASIIVIGYDMARELPRTIRSLSPAMQRDVSAEEYEIILIDNGSRHAFDEAALMALASNLSVHRMLDASVSPAAAVNLGLQLARGELVGVCIDGARMASPGLIAKAIAAAKLHPRPVIGTLAFHLGPKIQQVSATEGYNQAVEDELLARSGWNDDGYRLFGISSLAVSARRGWFQLPGESNALFCTADHWRALGGADERFVTPGGGFVNHDIWKRACEDPAAQVIMLLGEATFHQFHGGISTNAPEPPSAAFQEEYVRLRGRPHAPPTVAPLYFGGLGEVTKPSLEASLEWMLGRSAAPTP